MEFVIVTGLSGAGKTRAMHAMEDIGFFCVDNLPPALIPVFYDLCVQSEGFRNRAAVVTDTRGGELFKSFFTAMESLKRDKKPYKILFLDSSDGVLVNRFQETRRKHPLADEMGGALEQAVKLEREMLKPVKECSDYSQFLNAVRLIGDDGAVFSGSDLAFADQVLAGAKGGVIAASCVLPSQYAEIYRLAKAGDTKAAHELIFKYFALVKGLFGNGMHPSPLKYAMSLMGQEIGEWLTPVREPDEATKELLRTELERHGMLAR